MSNPNPDKPKIIDKLTPEQEAMLPKIRDKWIKLGFSTDPANRPEAEEGARKAYIAAGLEPPKLYIWAESPRAGAVVQAMVPLVVAQAQKLRAERESYIPAVAETLSSVASAYYQTFNQARDIVLGQAARSVRKEVIRQVQEPTDSPARRVGAEVETAINRDALSKKAIKALGKARIVVESSDLGDMRHQVSITIVDPARVEMMRLKFEVRSDSQELFWVPPKGDPVKGDPTRLDDLVTTAVHGTMEELSDALRNRFIVEIEEDSDYRRRLDEWWHAGIWGQHWGGYYSYYDAMRELGMEGLEPIDGALQVAANSGWWWCYRDYVVLTERPTVLHRDAEGRLHCEDGPALAYPDGWAQYSWHGTRVPKELIEGTWTPADILREQNAEVRRCAIEKMGWEAFIVEGKLKLVAPPVPDPGNPGHFLSLYEVPERLYEQPVRVLLCDNATPERDGTRRRFGLTVPASITDPVAAAAWTFGLNPDDYAQVEHAY